MPTTLPEGTVVPAGGDSYNLVPDLRKAFETTTSAAPVANATARTALVSARAAAGRPVTVSAPAIVVRADAPVSERLEVSYDGTAWERYRSGPPSAWVDLTLAAGWTKLPDSYAPPAQIWLDGGWVRARGLIRMGGSTAAGALVGTVPVGLRPSFTHHYIVATQDGYVTLSVAANGEIRIARNSGNAFLTTHWLDLTMLTWPVA